MIDDKRLQQLWDSIMPALKDIVQTKTDRFIALGVSQRVTKACCAEGGFTVGNYKTTGFDIRAYGWSPSKGNNWWKYIHWGTDIYEFHKERLELATEIAKEVQTFWEAQKRIMVDEDVAIKQEK